MQRSVFDALLPVISEARLTPYRKDITSDAKVLARYIWNVTLCESLYPALNGLEVSLRNSLHRVITDFQGDEYWFDSILPKDGTQYWSIKLQHAKQSLSGPGKVATADQIVAGMEFGFWTHLLTKPYEGKIWPWLLEPAFPNVPRNIRTRHQLAQKLDQCRRLRNRIFHHEPIWSWENLPATHQAILEVIGWISPEMRAFVQLVDRFHEVHSGDISSRESLIADFLTAN